MHAIRLTKRQSHHFVPVRLFVSRNTQPALHPDVGCEVHICFSHTYTIRELNIFRFGCTCWSNSKQKTCDPRVEFHSNSHRILALECVKCLVDCDCVNCFGSDSNHSQIANTHTCVCVTELWVTSYELRQQWLVRLCVILSVFAFHSFCRSAARQNILL